MPFWQAVSQVSWHGRGDYFAVVAPDGESQSVVIHQLSKRRTQVGAVEFLLISKSLFYNQKFVRGL